MARHYWFIFFFISGFCSLLYEVVWLRLAMAGYGVTTPLVSIVLSVFMGGLALGSWAGGALMARLRDRPAAVGVRFYGAAEALTAASALAVPCLLSWGRGVLVARANDWGSDGYYLASAGFILVALLPWCIGMGATFPFALFVLRRNGGTPAAARGFSYLYLANVAGAAAGTLVTAFVLIEVLGFSRTLAVAAAGNLLLAASAFGLSLRREPAAPSQPTPAVLRSPERPADAPVLAALFLTGLVSMGMEVVWIRQLTPYLGNLVYSFATILALYLMATAAGSSLYRRWSENAAREIPSSVWAGLAVTSLSALVMADPRLPLGELRQVGRLLRAFLTVVPFSTALGFLTPLLMDRWSEGEPRRAGTAYGFNIVGGILGPLVTGFLLLPHLGERGALVALAAPLLVGALLAPIGAASGVSRARSAVPSMVAAVVAMAVVVSLSRGYEAVLPGAVVRRDSTATVTAAGQDRSTKVLLVNGKGMTLLTPIAKMMAHLPFAFRTHPPREALVICFGMGTTYRSALSWGIDTTAVELIPSVPGLIGYFHADGEALLHTPRGRVVIDDGRRFLERSSRSYDAIVLDPPPPVEAAGSSLLYSRELYEAAQRRMTPDGILQQWIPEADAVVVSSFLKAAMEVFPYVRVFPSVEGWGVHVLASRQPIALATAAELAARMPPAAARDLVEWGPFSTPVEQYARVLSTETPPLQIVARAPDAPVLVDDRPSNEYFLVRRLGGARPVLRPRSR